MDVLLNRLEESSLIFSVSRQILITIEKNLITGESDMSNLVCAHEKKESRVSSARRSRTRVVWFVLVKKI
jgi:hypothetical protein